MKNKKINKIVKFYKKRLAEEETIYNEKLTELDDKVNKYIKERKDESTFILKDSLNRIYDTSGVYLGTSRIPNFIRKVLNKFFHLIFKPYFDAQSAFNSQVVHLLNEFIEYNERKEALQRDLYNALVQFNQKIIALIDAKSLKSGYENVKLILDYQKMMQEELRNIQDILMISYESIDRKLLSFMAQYLGEKRVLEPIETKNKEDSISYFPSAVNEENYYSYYYNYLNKARGDEKLIESRFKKYLKYIKKGWRVLDIGCGRGEFLELLKQRGISAYGIDINPEMIKRCKEKNLDVQQEEAIKHLSTVSEESIGFIMCSHVIEHIPFHLWVELLKLSKRALISDGILIIETLNPRSFYAMMEWYWKDPTHRHPVYPDYLNYLLKYIGFKEITISYFDEVSEQISLSEEKINDAQLQESIKKIKEFLFKPTEYFVLAIK